jgi:hypothetical protein
MMSELSQKNPGLFEEDLKNLFVSVHDRDVANALLDRKRCDIAAKQAPACRA